MWYNGTMKKAIGLMVIIFFAFGCATTPTAPDDLDMAIRDASDYLNDNIPRANKIVILNIQSDYNNLSEYIIEELIANAVNDKVFTVVDRAQLEIIRQERDFQMSGEVDDNTALAIGQFLGAQTIVSGRIIELGDRHRMTIRALNVQTATVQGQYNRNIATSRTIIALMRGSRPQTTSYAARNTSTVNTSTATTTARQPAQPAANIANGTYSFFPRPRAMVEGRDTNTYLEKIVVRGGFFIMYFTSVPIGLTNNLPTLTRSWHWRSFSAIIQDLDRPSRTVTTTNRNDVNENGGTYAIWTFANHNIRQFSFKSTCTSAPDETEYHFIFEEINLNNAEYTP
jgi:TolB-like protein